MLCELKNQRERAHDIDRRLEAPRQEEVRARWAFDDKMREIKSERRSLMEERDRLVDKVRETERKRHRIVED